MRVVDTGSTSNVELWVAPLVAAALYPTELPWKEDPQTDEERAVNAQTEAALAQATWLLDSLTRGRLHGVECWIEDYALHSCELVLRRGPVIHVEEVVVTRSCGQKNHTIQQGEWCHVRANTISFCCNCSFSQFTCGCDDTVIRVKYQIGSTIPPGTGSLTAWLAAELAKSAKGQKCALPDRISNVTRQGVSWTIMDPQDFMEKGRTGMDRVDQWLQIVNMQTGQGSLIDPLRSDRTFQEQLDCTTWGEFGDLNPADPVPDPFTAAFNTGVVP